MTVLILMLPLKAIHHIKSVLINEEVDSREGKPMKHAGGITLPQRSETAAFHNLLHALSHGHGEPRPVLLGGYHGMDLEEDGQATERGGDRLGDGTGYSATYQMLGRCQSS